MSFSLNLDRLGDFGNAVQSVDEVARDNFRGTDDVFQDNTRGTQAALDDIAAQLNGPGIADFDGLAALADRLPAELRGPDATGDVRTGSFAITRVEADTAARLAAAPRIVEALGPDAVSIDLPGQSFGIVERYVDAVSGFSALRLRSADGSQEVFAIDGLEVGSRADEVAAATLGTLQVESAAFREMVNDSLASVLVDGRALLFTGPSLGGAVAQVAAYEAAEGLRATGIPFGPGSLGLVTVDPLGGRDAAEEINGGQLDPATLNLIKALNLRTEGDIVSRIGSHIGDTLTLPAVDAAGNRVQLSAAEAHVNVVSLLQVLGSDTLVAQGVLGSPGEIGGFAAVSDTAGQALGDAWVLSGGRDDGGADRLQIPGNAAFNANATRWELDADADGLVDIAVNLRAPASPATADLVL